MCACLSKETRSSELCLFVAVDLPAPVRTAIQQVSQEFAAHARVLKTVRSDLLHITLRFLGNVPQERSVIVERAIHSAARPSTAFTLTVSGPRAFPNGRAPRVLWMGIERDAGYRALETLASQVDQALVTEGLQFTSSTFSPHITFGRTRDRISKERRSAIADTLQRVQALGPDPISFAVQKITVIRSELLASGPRYSPMCEVRLGMQEA